jgi:hypothetical protein
VPRAKEPGNNRRGGETSAIETSKYLCGMKSY